MDCTYPTMTVAMQPKLEAVYEMYRPMQNYYEDTESEDMAQSFQKLRFSNPNIEQDYKSARSATDKIAKDIVTMFFARSQQVKTIQNAANTSQIPLLTFPANCDYKHKATWIPKYIYLMKRLTDQLLELDYPREIRGKHNPLKFASTGHDAYLSLMPQQTPRYLFVGMNPGPHGSQCGIPFGSKTSVEDILKINFQISEEGLPFEYKSTDYSGKFWDAVKIKCGGDMEKFFKKAFVLNYCPLLFLNKDEHQITLENIGKKYPELGALLDKHCIKAMKDVIKLLNPTHVIAIGKHVEERMKRIEEKHPNLKFNLRGMTHPAWTGHVKEYSNSQEKKKLQEEKENQWFDRVKNALDDLDFQD